MSTKESQLDLLEVLEKLSNGNRILLQLIHHIFIKAQQFGS